VVYATGKRYTPIMDAAPSEQRDADADALADIDLAARPLFERLAEVATAIEAERSRYQAATKPLIEERNRLWRELTAQGYSRRDLARVSRVTAMVVQAVIKGRARDRARKSRQGR
jgi:hypothetical protein